MNTYPKIESGAMDEEINKVSDILLLKSENYIVNIILDASLIIERPNSGGPEAYFPCVICLKE